jgi:hypothetical protein
VSATVSAFLLRAALRLGMRERVLRLLQPKHRRYRLTSPSASEGAHGVPSTAVSPSRWGNDRILFLKQSACVFIRHPTLLTHT